MKIVFCFILLLLTSTSFAQDSTLMAPKDSIKITYWKLKSIFGLNGSQTSYTNWNAGGQNNVSLLSFISASAYYQKLDFKWDNDLNLALGGLKYTSKNVDPVNRAFQKTDDRIDYSSTIGYKLRKDVYLSMVTGFRTQFIDGFNLPNDSVRISAFMAPGYLNFGLGIEYTPSNDFQLFASPLSAKLTFVQSTDLANRGAFGVEKGVFDTLGNLVSPGKKFRAELGAYLKLKYNKNLAKNIDVKTRLELFSNYLNNPENIDVNAEVSWYFKVNNWFSASLQWVLVYDDDIDITDASGKIGPRTQFKSVLGVGISYTLRNFKE